MNKQRLLNVARALRESPNPDKFDMKLIQHSCGTPACALGHYVARTDLQSAFLPPPIGARYRINDVNGLMLYPFGPLVLGHFGLSETELEELFDEEGCGGAKTAVEAAEYIEKFVNENES